MKKKIIAGILTLALLIQFIPVNSYAAMLSSDTDVSTEAETTEWVGDSTEEVTTETETPEWIEDSIEELTTETEITELTENSTEEITTETETTELIENSTEEITTEEHDIEISPILSEGIIDEGMCGDIYWCIDEDYTLTFKPISGGEGYFDGMQLSWTQYADQIRRVESEGLIHLPDYCSWIFRYFPNCLTMDLSGFDISDITNMDQIFANCYSLISLDLSGWNTENVTYMSGMFRGCYNLTQIIGINDLNTEKVTNMSFMFSNCYSLTSLDLSNWNTQSVTDMRLMFGYCYNLVSLNLSGWSSENMEDTRFMFSNCYRLNEITFGPYFRFVGDDVYVLSYSSWMLFDYYSIGGLYTGNWVVKDDPSIIIKSVNMYPQPYPGTIVREPYSDYWGNSYQIIFESGDFYEPDFREPSQIREDYIIDCTYQIYLSVDYKIPNLTHKKLQKDGYVLVGWQDKYNKDQNGESLKFLFDENGVAIVPGGTYENGTINTLIPIWVKEEDLVENPNAHEVNIKKVDVSENNLPGATLILEKFDTVVDNDGYITVTNNHTMLLEWMSDVAIMNNFGGVKASVTFEDDLKVKLESGFYLVVEDRPPSGYKSCDPIGFYVTEDGKVYMADYYLLNFVGLEFAVNNLDISLWEFVDNSVIQVVNQSELTPSPDPIEVSIPLAKRLEGRDSKYGEFTFELYDEQGVKVAYTYNQTSTDGQMRSTSFQAIEFWYPGEYKYTIKEVCGDDPNIEYDDRIFEVTVNVILNPKTNTLMALFDKSVNELCFTNIYTTPPVDVSIPFTKTIFGGDAVAGAFQFNVYDKDDKIVKEINNETLTDAQASDMSFTITCDKEGFYTYKIKEVIGEDENITYDEREYEIIIDVTKDNSTGQLLPTCIYTCDGEVVESIDFVNTYKSADLSIDKQTVTGSSVEGATLQILTIDNKPITDKNGDVLYKWITDGSKYEIHGLTVGIYILREVSAPEGFMLSEDIYFMVCPDGSVQVCDYDKINNIVRESVPVDNNEIIMIDIPYEYDISVTKKVTGNMGNKTKLFKFTLRLSESDFTSKYNIGIPTSIQYLLNGEMKTATLNSEHEYEFTLQHNNSIQFLSIPYGVKYEVIEYSEDYKPSIEITHGNGVISDSKVSGTLDSNVAMKYTNTKDGRVPTDATTQFKWVMILLLLPTLWFLGIFLKKKKSKRG